MQLQDRCEILGSQNLEMKKSSESQEILQNGSMDYKRRPAVKCQTGGWKSVILILGTELCERLATLGIGLNLITYLVTELHLSPSQAPNIVTNFLGTSYVCCLIGGFVADTCLGRFWTIVSFSFVQFMGMLLLTLSAGIPSLRPSKCNAEDYKTCQPARGMELAVLYMALYMTALGTGGIKACVSAFGADQFDDSDAKERRSMGHFFNWFFVAISIGTLLAVTVLIYIQDNVGRSWGYGSSAGSMFMAICVFLAGTPLYRYRAPNGTSIVSIAHVLVAAFRKRHGIPGDEKDLYEDPGQQSARFTRTSGLSFLDKAAIVETGSSSEKQSPWRLCSVTKVEQVKMLIRILPICATSVLVYTVFAQMTTLAVEQGATMRRNLGKHFKFPPASLGVFVQLSVIIATPLYDQVFLPAVKLLRRNQITMLQRIGGGMIFSCLAMVIAAMVERKRLALAREHGLLDRPKATVPMSIFWLVPQYALVGVSEVFTYIGQLEFFYSQSPEEMRSMATGMFMSTISVGFFASSFLVATINRVTGGSGHGWISNNINRGRIDNFYWMLAVLSLGNLAIHIACATCYKYRALPVAPPPRVADAAQEA
ncbi:protein NRT1/ PTR FAMILY 6.2 [Selaginella moellendorffii]|uniref:protein NRT1/ PTR FAMILY 6.2 n=1 Tax=Selaginella moellendorffii TaxID=88036 RepID=UPI000D1C80C9|nr:protein NRT1/ PTR FAMILY 6.2 [Selaginella moellendorffii]XP_024533103.1 protein NRT1/ PTR FAMILY 6.2 [Selaginella moellendorffii]|eukprot:XP_024533102.1 protein NRT1/ PTR FAMILY 6.2 [Selaginella moellendorffii]